MEALGEEVNAGTSQPLVVGQRVRLGSTRDEWEIRLAEPSYF